MKTKKGFERGVLYIVATPIGNNDDMSSRAREILIACDRVAAEDTRRAARLLAELGGNRHKLISFHEHNEHNRCAQRLSPSCSSILFRWIFT